MLQMNRDVLEGTDLAHSSAVRKLAQFSKEKQCPLSVMKSHISFSWFKVLVESGFLWPSEVKRLWNLNNRMQSWTIIHQCLQNGKSTTVKCSFWNGLLVDSIFHFLNDQRAFYQNEQFWWNSKLQIIFQSSPLFPVQPLTLLLAVRHENISDTPATLPWHSWTDRVNSLSGYCSWHQIKQVISPLRLFNVTL